MSEETFDDLRDVNNEDGGFQWQNIRPYTSANLSE